MVDFEEKYAYFLNEFNTAFKNYFNQLDTNPKVLGDSMRYSAMLGGKRIRPVLMCAVGELFGIDINVLQPFAIALEMIHTYSLIHDDLPEMDNDDFRRGKPSNHKVYGAANAVLAGDGLLNTAYSLLFDECDRGTTYLSAAKFICNCAGIHGMIAGQSADILHENDSDCSEEILNFIYENKTAKLIIAAVCVPAILAGGSHCTQVERFGQELGFLFQLTDDILDACGSFELVGKTLGKDAASDKYTAVKLYGLEKCKNLAEEVCRDCHDVLNGLGGGTDFLHQLVDFVKLRVN